MNLNKRTLIAGAFALAFAAPALAQASLTTLDGADRAAALARANATLNGVAALTGRFTQRSPDGSVARGTFYLQRPGRLRFEYDPPATMLIVSDGSVVSLRDSALRTTERTPLRSTPLNLVLRNQIDLARDSRIVRVSTQGEWLVVTARDRAGQTDGTISMHFQGPNAELRSWDIVDATGGRTRITLSDITRPASLNSSLFRLEDMLDRNRPGRR